MNNDDRSDRDVHPRRRCGAYAACLGAVLAAAIIPASPAFADSTDDAVPALMTPGEGLLDKDIATLFGEINSPSLAGPDIEVTNALLGLLPGGATGPDATEVENLLVTDLYTPLIDALGALGGAAPGAAAADAVPALMTPGEGLLDKDIATLFGDINDPSLAGPDIEVTNALLGLLPGGATGPDATEIETLLVTDIYNPLLDSLGGVRAQDAAAADAVPAAKVPVSEDAILNHDIIALFDALHDPSGGGLDVQATDSLLGLLPGGATGTDGIEVETLLANDLYTPAIDLLGTLIGGGVAF